VAAPAAFQLKQVVDILKPRLAARHIDLRAMDPGPVETNLAEARQKITIKLMSLVIPAEARIQGLLKVM
jgi:hypothetical protein